MNDTKYWIWLVMIFGTASKNLWKIMCAFETAEEAYYEMCSDSRLLNLTASERRNLKRVTLSDAENVISECESRGIKTVCYSSEKYPNQLKYIVDPPAVLYYRGNIDCLIGTKTITAVGTRKISDYGRRTVRRICSELAANGIIIISGFAVGTDIEANLAAISENMPTACVMGAELDHDYPKENFKYRDMIIEAGGVLISEYKPGSPTVSANFSARNRILSALGRAVVIFEAPSESGSLSTADYAAEQGREVFSLPPADIFSDSYAGNVNLLRNGALPVFSADEILAYFSFGTPIMAEITSDFSSFAEKIKNHENKIPTEKHIIKEIDKTYGDTGENSVAENKAENISNADKIISDLMLKGNQKKIVEFLANGAVHKDIIAQNLDIKFTDLLTEITELEIIGVLKLLPGNMVEIKI